VSPPTARKDQRHGADWEAPYQSYAPELISAHVSRCTLDVVRVQGGVVGVRFLNSLRETSVRLAAACEQYQLNLVKGRFELLGEDAEELILEVKVGTGSCQASGKA
jgi:hypothetical protein